MAGQQLGQWSLLGWPRHPGLWGAGLWGEEPEGGGGERPPTGSWATAQGVGRRARPGKHARLLASPLMGSQGQWRGPSEGTEPQKPLGY